MSFPDLTDPVAFASILGFAGLLIANLVQAFNSHRISKEARKLSGKEANTNAKEANTHEFEVMRQGFVDSFEELRRQLQEGKDEATTSRAELQDQITESQKKISTQSGQITTLTKRVHKLEAQKIEMIEHIIEIETLVPTPPGVPSRPEWD